MAVRSWIKGLALTGALAVTVAGCAEDLLAPGNGTCPDYCPPGQVQVIDSVLLDNVLSDSTFSGYVQPHAATALQVFRDSSAAGDVGSRAVMTFPAFTDSLLLSGGDTTRGVILGTDSFVVVIPMRGRNVAAAGLELNLYRIPVGTDSTTTLVDLDPFFTDSTLLAVVPVPDSAVSDTLRVVLDSLAFPTFDADGRRTALGVTLRSPVGYVQLGAENAQDGVILRRHVQLDSAGTSVARVTGSFPMFDSFLGPATVGAGPDERAVGGAPSSRTLLRFTLPPRIADSSAVLRATLVLVPVRPTLGAPGDSVGVIAQGLAADVGAKSPLQTIPSDSVGRRLAFLAVGSADTVRLDVTDLVIGWVRDSTRPRAVAVRALPEGGSFGELRIGAAASGAARPRLHLTFVPPLTLGGR